jgi:PTS system cellobiose-specific IIC component
MDKIAELLETKFAPFFGKIGSNKIVNGLKEGMVTSVPFTIIGSFFIILSEFPIESWQNIVGPFKPMLGAGNTMTMGIIALYVAFAMGYSMGKQYEFDPLMSGLVSFVSFMFLQIGEDYAISDANFGSRGIFTAIVISIFTTKVTQLFIKRNWYIRFPEGVPSAVENSFAALVPTFFILIILWIFRAGLGIDITEIIIAVFSPLVFALNTLPGILVFITVSQLLWTIGIHGMSIVNAVGTPVFLTYLTANSEAAIAGESLPYITAVGFIPNFVSFGGAGATFGLVVLMMFSKEKTYKTLGRLAFPAAIFNINEPVIFGLPIVLNPIMMIPFVLVDIILVTGTYLLMFFDIIGRPFIQVPWVTPPVLGAYLTTGGNIPAAVWSLIGVIISILVYYPFFKILERQRLSEATDEEGETIV